MQFDNRQDIRGGPNTSSLERLTSTGASGATVERFVSAVAPEGVIIGSPGDLCSVRTATQGFLYLKASGNATNTGWVLVSLPAKIVPISVNHNPGAAANIAAGASVNAIPSTNVTITANMSGRVRIDTRVQISMGSILLGGNQVDLFVLIDGVEDVNATTTEAISGVALTLDAKAMNLISTPTLAVGLHSVEVRARRPAGAASTASLTNAIRQLRIQSWD